MKLTSLFLIFSFLAMEVLSFCEHNTDCSTLCCVEGECVNSNELCFSHYSNKPCESHFECESCCINGVCGSLSDCFFEVYQKCNTDSLCPVCCLENGWCGGLEECYEGQNIFCFSHTECQHCCLPNFSCGNQQECQNESCETGSDCLMETYLSDCCQNGVCNPSILCSLSPDYMWVNNYDGECQKDGDCFFCCENEACQTRETCGATYEYNSDSIITKYSDSDGQNEETHGKETSQQSNSSSTSEKEDEACGNNPDCQGYSCAVDTCNYQCCDGANCGSEEFCSSNSFYSVNFTWMLIMIFGPLSFFFILVVIISCFCSSRPKKKVQPEQRSGNSENNSLSADQMIIRRGEIIDAGMDLPEIPIQVIQLDSSQVGEENGSGFEIKRSNSSVLSKKVDKHI